MVFRHSFVGLKGRYKEGFVHKRYGRRKRGDFLVHKTLKLICYIRVKEKTAFKAC